MLNRIKSNTHNFPGYDFTKELLLTLSSFTYREHDKSESNVSLHGGGGSMAAAAWCQHGRGGRLLLVDCCLFLPPPLLLPSVSLSPLRAVADIRYPRAWKNMF